MHDLVLVYVEHALENLGYPTLQKVRWKRFPLLCLDPVTKVAPYNGKFFRTETEEVDKFLRT